MSPPALIRFFNTALWAAAQLFPAVPGETLCKAWEMKHSEIVGCIKILGFY